MLYDDDEMNGLLKSWSCSFEGSDIMEQDDPQFEPIRGMDMGHYVGREPGIDARWDSYIR